jgi:hypothetical protein
MAVAGLVLGIVSFVISFIPCVGLLAILPAILGIIFSIIGISKAKTTGQGKGMAIAGLILSILAIAWVPIYILLIVGGAAATSASF